MSGLTKTYPVRFFAFPGKTSFLSEEAWQEAEILDDFQYPWQAEVPPPTIFRALHTDSHLHFFFEVEDPQLFADTTTAGKMAALETDRVEIFFRKDQDMRPYYCLEMDYLGRVLDYKADYYRQMNFDWDWPAGFSFRSSLTEKGYQVEGYIDKSILEKFGVLKDAQLEAGLFRAQFVSPNDILWISWINSGTEKPDFHVPAAFGVLKLI